jgi:hypothetical protein
VAAWIAAYSATFAAYLVERLASKQHTYQFYLGLIKTFYGDTWPFIKQYEFNHAV